LVIYTFLSSISRILPRRGEYRPSPVNYVPSFFDVLKGFNVQFNVVDKATLLNAQIHPEQHRDLIVRVTG